MNIKLNKIIKIQNFIRYSLAVKKFNRNVELLTNIIQLDFAVNLIKDKKTEEKLLLLYLSK